MGNDILMHQSLSSLQRVTSSGKKGKPMLEMWINSFQDLPRIEDVNVLSVSPSEWLVLNVKAIGWILVRSG